jgi:hypothetical protein
MRIGQRLRVASDTGWLEGHAVALRSDTLWLSRSDALPRLAVPLSSATRLEQFARPTAGQGGRRGARIGAAVGLMGAVAWCVVDQADCREESGKSGAGGLVVGALRWMPLLGLTGGVYGAIAGVVVRGPKRWHPVHRTDGVRRSGQGA